jgi:hypothetical protein
VKVVQVDVFNADGAVSCYCVRVGSLVGDRLLTTSGYSNQYATNGTLRLFDLAGGRSATLLAGNVPYEAYPYGYLLPDGGVVAYAQGYVGFPVTFGDSAGNRTLSDLVGATLAPSKMTAPGTTGFYATNTAGAAVRVASAGESEQQSWVPAPKLAPRPNKRRLRHAPVVERRTVAVIDGYAVVKAAKHRAPKRPWLEVYGQRITQPSTAPLPTVLATSSAGWLLLSFPSRDGKEAVTELRAVGSDRALLTLPTASLPTEPGSIALTTEGGVAAASGDTLRVWDPAPRTLTVPGVHDLATPGNEGSDQANALYYSDAAGEAHRIELGARTRGPSQPAR